jgi:leucyl-tRNA synthetase
VRGLVELPSSAGRADVETAAFDLPKIKEMTGNGQVVEVIYVPGKIMNILTKPSSPD